MTVEKYLDSLFKEMNIAIFVAELETDIIVYFNETFAELLPERQELIGQSFHQIFTRNTIKCPYTFTKDWNQKEIYVTEVYVEETKTHYHISNTKIEFQGVYYNLCKIVQSEDNQSKGMSFEAAMTHCIATFQKPPETILHSLLEILAQFYESERAYIYRVDAKKGTIRCSASWCEDPNYQVVDEVDTVIDVPIWLNWMKNHQELGTVQIDSQKEDFDWNSTEAIIIKAFKMKNCSLGILEDEGQEIIGIVGFSNFCNEKIDLRLLRAVVRFVAQSLNKETTEAVFSVLDKDMLTGCFSRNAFSKRVEEVRNEGPASLGVVSANINGLKLININLGIVEGDKHIKFCAKVLQKHFEYAFYRISGDEFIAFAPDSEKDVFEDKVKELYEKMKKEDDYNFAMGHAWESGKYDLNHLIHQAEAIRYINKQEYYHVSQRHFSTVNNKLLSELLTYLENDEFMIYLQPQVRLKDSSIYGAEALIRRFDKTNQKMVFPDQFISLYEQNSVIRHVDIFVIETVCRLLQEWCDKGVELPISVNLSRVTLQEYGIVDTIVEICDKYNVPHHLLVIEVTERIGLVENNVASALITQFKEEGFNISLDDFGCAYSNIVTLAQIEVDEVKLDKSLVDDLTTSKKNHILVKNVLTMCNELEGTSTLAEGIEDEHQAKLLYELGCHLGQGYFYSRPIPVNEFIEKYIP